MIILPPIGSTRWRQHPDPAVGKSQLFRLIDIFVLAPAMIYVGATGMIPPLLRAPAIVGGVATVAYNWVNYDRLRESESA